MRSALRAVILLLLLILPIPGALAAQGVTGVVADRQSGAPVGGALVQLLGPDGRVRAQVLADAGGRFALRAPAAGRYTLRAQRIGYADAVSPPLDLAAGQVVEYRIAAPEQRVQLAAVVAQGEGKQCVAPPEEGVETAALWDEAQKALRSTVQSTQQYPYRFKVERRIRQLDAATLTVRHEEVRPAEGFSDNPFVALDAQRLATGGYVQAIGDTVFFHAPDAAVLLSDAFLGTHCFRARAADEDHAGLVGLAFEPARNVHTPDVSGVLWMDARTAELKVVEYRYVNYQNNLQGPELQRGDVSRIESYAAAIPDNERVGGRVEFRRLPSGAWITSRWRIMMPAANRAPRSNAAPVPGQTPPQVELAMGEEAGEVLELQLPDGTAVEMASYAKIDGTVWDSTRAAPLAGAEVSLAGTDRHVQTDAGGRYGFDRVAEGAYALTFSHPRLDSLHFVPEPVRVEALPPNEVRRDLAIPSMASILAAGCAAPAGSDVAVLAGIVTGRGGGGVAPGVSVSAAWPTAAGGEERAMAVTDETGAYRFCGLPPGVPVRIVARGSADSAVAAARTQRGVPAQADLQVNDATAALLSQLGSAHVLAHLVDQETGRPIVGAKLGFSGAFPDQTTDRRGDFELNDVVPGTYAFTFDHPTYGAGVARLIVRGRGTVEYEVRIPHRTVMLDPLTVTARRMYPGDFNVRERGRRLNIVTREEIERRLGAAGHVSDLVRTFPGVQVHEVRYPTGTVKGYCVVDNTGMGRGGVDPEASTAPTDEYSPRGRLGALTGGSCAGAKVMLDDVLVGDEMEFFRDFPINDTESVIYLKPSDAMGRYGTIGANGLVLIYTRGNGPTVDRQ